MDQKAMVCRVPATRDDAFLNSRELVPRVLFRSQKHHTSSRTLMMLRMFSRLKLKIETRMTTAFSIWLQWEQTVVPTAHSGTAVHVK